MISTLTGMRSGAARIGALAAAAILASAVSAGAVSLSFGSFAGSSKTLDGAFGLDGNAAYLSHVPAGTGRQGDTITTFSGLTKSALNGVSVDGPAKVTLTYLGASAAYANFGVVLGNDVVFRNQASGSNPASTIGETASFTVSQGGLLPFAFHTKGVNAPDGATIANDGGVSPWYTFLAGMAIGYSDIYAGGTAINVFFDDSGAHKDRDYNDMAFRIDVAEIGPGPDEVPEIDAASGLGALGALGGLLAFGWERRRRVA
jgi:hypothetical protein